MADARLQVRVDQDEKALWEKAAKAQGVEFSHFVREAVNLRASFDPWFWAQIKRHAGQMRISEDFLIEAMVIDKRTDEDSDTIVYGPMPRSVGYIAFEVNEEGNKTAIRGRRLYKNRLENKVGQKKQKKEFNESQDRLYEHFIKLSEAPE